MLLRQMGLAVTALGLGWGLSFGSFGQVAQAAAQPAAMTTQIDSGIPAGQGQAAAADSQAFERVYRLGPGDKLRITVYNEDQISGEYELDSQGCVSLQLLGTMCANQLTLSDLRNQMEIKLRDGLMVNPSVAVEVLNYRPFYVLGEVSAPGSYPYVAGITILKAIAQAGGYTYRARERPVEVIHSAEPDKKVAVDPSDQVLPGDIIRVKERFF